MIEVPAHTAGHIAYHLPSEAIVFVGDTLFAMGCGRLFEGTAGADVRQHARLAALPPETIVYCAHEYTQSNGRYALVAEPDNRGDRRRGWTQVRRRPRGGRGDGADDDRARTRDQPVHARRQRRRTGRAARRQGCVSRLNQDRATSVDLAACLAEFVPCVTRSSSPPPR